MVTSAFFGVPLFLLVPRAGTQSIQFQRRKQNKCINPTSKICKEPLASFRFWFWFVCRPYARGARSLFFLFVDSKSDFSTLAQSRRSQPPLCPLRLRPIPQPPRPQLHADGHRHNKHSVWPPAETQGKEGRKRGRKPPAPEPPHMSPSTAAAPPPSFTSTYCLGPLFRPHSDGPFSSGTSPGCCRARSRHRPVGS